MQDECNHPHTAALFGVPEVGILCDHLGSPSQANLRIYEDDSRLLTKMA